MSRKNKLCLIVLVFIAGLAMFLYPIVNGARLEANADAAVDSFIQSTTVNPNPQTPVTTPIPYPELYDEMKVYNEKILEEKQKSLSDPWAYEAPGLDISEYGLENNVIAVLEIPKLELEMPVYLGANADNMAAGSAVLGQTSMPIGGMGTNCVIAGHRGWNGAAYFLNIDQLEVGDEVKLTNLWETLRYEVVELQVIDPNDVDKILIKSDSELLTLLTCHPPSTGGMYRLLVICRRCESNT